MRSRARAGVRAPWEPLPCSCSSPAQPAPPDRASEESLFSARGRERATRGQMLNSTSVPAPVGQACPRTPLPCLSWAGRAQAAPPAPRSTLPQQQQEERRGAAHPRSPGAPFGLAGRLGRFSTPLSPQLPSGTTEAPQMMLGRETPGRTERRVRGRAGPCSRPNHTPYPSRHGKPQRAGWRGAVALPNYLSQCAPQPSRAVRRAAQGTRPQPAPARTAPLLSAASGRGGDLGRGGRWRLQACP